MHGLALTLLLSTTHAAPALSCAAQLNPADLQLKALSKVLDIPEFRSPIWEFAFKQRGSAPFIFVVGPDSARKTAAIQKLIARVGNAKSYDVPTHSQAAILAGKHEWYASAWLADVDLHILDLGLPRDFKMHAWQDFDGATAELARLGFTDDEMMAASGLYLITP